MSDAIVLLSGGIDSATALAMTRADGPPLPRAQLPLRPAPRRRAGGGGARRRARWAPSAHDVIDLDLRAIGGSALTADIAVPKGRSEAEIGSGIPVTYVPARNTIFLAYAIALAEVRERLGDRRRRQRARLVGLPRLPSRMAGGDAGGGARSGRRRASSGGRSPSARRSSRCRRPRSSARASKLGVDYGLTHSCYDPAPSGAACGACDSCQLRRRGFETAGVADPTRYAWKRRGCCEVSRRASSRGRRRCRCPGTPGAAGVTRLRAAARERAEVHRAGKAGAGRGGPLRPGRCAGRGHRQRHRRPPVAGHRGPRSRRAARRSRRRRGLQRARQLLRLGLELRVADRRHALGDDRAADQRRLRPPRRPGTRSPRGAAPRRETHATAGRPFRRRSSRAGCSAARAGSAARARCRAATAAAARAPARSTGRQAGRCRVRRCCPDPARRAAAAAPAPPGAGRSTAATGRAAVERSSAAR